MNVEAEIQRRCCCSLLAALYLAAQHIVPFWGFLVCLCRVGGRDIHKSRPRPQQCRGSDPTTAAAAAPRSHSSTDFPPAAAPSGIDRCTPESQHMPGSSNGFPAGPDESETQICGRTTERENRAA